MRVDLAIVADAGKAIAEMVRLWKAQEQKADATALKDWWAQIDRWRAKKSLAYRTVRHADQAAICHRPAL